jgi:hypothetical protein
MFSENNAFNAEQGYGVSCAITGDTLTLHQFGFRRERTALRKVA